MDDRTELKIFASECKFAGHRVWIDLRADSVRVSESPRGHSVWLYKSIYGTWVVIPGRGDRSSTCFGRDKLSLAIELAEEVIREWI